MAKLIISPAAGKYLKKINECNDYMAEWNFDNWGIRYWSRTPEFEEYLKSGTS